MLLHFLRIANKSLENHEKAAQASESASKVNPRNTNALNNLTMRLLNIDDLGASHSETGDFEKSHHIFLNALSFDPTNAETTFNKAKLDLLNVNYAIVSTDMNNAGR